MKKRNILITLLAVILGLTTFAQADYHVNDFTVIGDGTTINTKNLQTLIDKVSAEQGGKIVFPKGTYLTGSLLLKPNVHLHFEEGAILLGSTNPYDYINIEMPGRPKLGSRDDNSQMALLVAFKADNISISGKGRIDGQGRALALNIDSLHHIGERIDPKYNTNRMRPNETHRPKLFRFSMCNHVNISGLELWNGACWGLSFELCNTLNIDDVKVLNRAYWNNDGMDITDCRNVRITNCDVNSADDGICLKSYYPDHANDSIYIANCTIRSSASAIKFGTASFGGFKNVKIENIKVYDTFRSAIAIESVDGGDIENIEVSNITAENTGNAIFIRLGHRAGEKPGSIKNVYIHDIKAQIPFERPDTDYDMRGPAVTFFHNPFPSSIVGIPGHYIENVRLENIEITYPGRASKGMAYVPLTRLNQVPEQIGEYPEFHMFRELPSWGFYIRHAKGISMKNISLNLEQPDFRPPFVFDDVSEIKMKLLNLPESNRQIVVTKVSKLDLDPEIQQSIRNMDK
jgi:hypothetical protein